MYSLTRAIGDRASDRYRNFSSWFEPRFILKRAGTLIRVAGLFEAALVALPRYFQPTFAALSGLRAARRNSGDSIEILPVGWFHRAIEQPKTRERGLYTGRTAGEIKIRGSETLSVARNFCFPKQFFHSRARVRPWARSEQIKSTSALDAAGASTSIRPCEAPSSRRRRHRPGTRVCARKSIRKYV